MFAVHEVVGMVDGSVATKLTGAWATTRLVLASSIRGADHLATRRVVNVNLMGGTVLKLGVRFCLTFLRSFFDGADPI